MSRTKIRVRAIVELGGQTIIGPWSRIDVGEGEDVTVVQPIILQAANVEHTIRSYPTQEAMLESLERGE